MNGLMLVLWFYGWNLSRYGILPLSQTGLNRADI